MKTLVYTISDGTPQGLACANLLYEYLQNKENFDFLIISNKKFNSGDFNTLVVEDYNHKYVGMLKYTEKLPKNYDSYVYLDSDILFFDDPLNLVNKNKKIGIVKETFLMTEGWNYYSQGELSNKLSSLQGVNAGSFSVKDLKYMKKVRDLVKRAGGLTDNLVADAKLEQSAFNYMVAEATDLDLSKCHDFTEKSVLFAANSDFSKQKTLYHFNGFTGEMTSKYISMTKFVQKHKDQINLLNTNSE
jgi:hypothetical protein